MHFCVKCSNMYYIRITEDDANKLIYYCRNCGHEDTILTSENVCVTKTQLSQSEKTYSHIINKYTKLDPTLPRINSIKCPNQTCASNKEGGVEREVIYMRYDDTNMKYIYICTHCDTIWNTAEPK
jgi:DNA-directed RNA polymerase subunit M/transcription elongation factor TFIIS